MCRYLGLFAKEIEAAQAYDRESVKRKGLKAITNFDISEYLELLSTPPSSLTSSPWSDWNYIASRDPSPGGMRYLGSLCLEQLIL